LVLLVGMQTIGTIFAIAVDTNDIGELVIGLALATALLCPRTACTVLGR